MARKKSNSDDSNVLGFILAILGGAAIAYGIAKALSGGGEHYECPICYNTFKGKPLNCPNPNCNVAFKW